MSGESGAGRADPTRRHTRWHARPHSGARSGLSHLGVALTFGHRIRYAAVPVAPVLALAVVWWFYWEDLRSLLLAPVEE